jgi:hypothetical protein
MTMDIEQSVECLASETRPIAALSIDLTRARTKAAKVGLQFL